MRRTRAIGRAAALLAAWLLCAPAAAELRIGLLVAGDGPFAEAALEARTGAEMALREAGGAIAGRPVQWVRASSDGLPAGVTAAVRRLVDDEKVTLVVGPTMGAEGYAVKEFARQRPAVTFVDGASAAQATTVILPAANFHRFHPDSAQWLGGLGREALARGWKRMVLVAEDYTFGWSQAQGFMVDYCAGGGRVVDKLWVAIGTQDFSRQIASIPRDADALLVLLPGADASNFLEQYLRAGGARPWALGSVTAEGPLLEARGRRRDLLARSVGAAPVLPEADLPGWSAFAAAYRAQARQPDAQPGWFAYAYYLNTRALLAALAEVGGDLSDGHRRLREALARQRVDGPLGPVVPDGMRRAVAPTVLFELRAGAGPRLAREPLRVQPAVDPQLGLSREAFENMGPGSHDRPDCR